MRHKVQMFGKFSPGNSGFFPGKVRVVQISGISVKVVLGISEWSVLPNGLAKNKDFGQQNVDSGGFPEVVPSFSQV